MFDLDDWKKGDNIFEAAHHQKAVTALKQLGNTLAGDGLIQFQTPGGTVLSVKDYPPRATDQLWVVVTDYEGLGKYTGFEFTMGNDDIDPDTDVTFAEMGESEAVQILIVNVMEIESTASGPFLSVDSIYPAWWSTSLCTDGRSVAMVRDIDPEVCP